MYLNRILIASFLIISSLTAADLSSAIKYIDAEEEDFLSSLTDKNVEAKDANTTVASPKEAKPTMAPKADSNISKEKVEENTNPPTKAEDTTPVSPKTKADSSLPAKKKADPVILPKPKEMPPKVKKGDIDSEEEEFLNSLANQEIEAKDESNTTEEIVDKQLSSEAVHQKLISALETAPDENLSKQDKADHNLSVDIKVDLSDQTMIVSQNGKELYRWRVATGTNENPTPKGKYNPQFFKKLYKDDITKEITMHYAIFFKDSHAIVASQSNKALDSHSSKTGGVKISMANAKTLFELVVKAGKDNTNILIVK